MIEFIYGMLLNSADFNQLSKSVQEKGADPSVDCQRRQRRHHNITLIVGTSEMYMHLDPAKH